MINNNDGGVPMAGTPAPTPDMAQEPALTLGELFASKAMIKTYVAAILGLVATVLKFAVTDQMVDDIATVVQLVAIVAAPVMAQLENKQRALKQGEVTREAVYAPATVQRLVETAAATGDPTVPPPPAK